MGDAVDIGDEGKDDAGEVDAGDVRDVCSAGDVDDAKQEKKQNENLIELEKLFVRYVRGQIDTRIRR